MMKIKIEETIKFFDEGQNSRGHATAIRGRDLPISTDSKSNDMVKVSRYYWEHQKKEFSKDANPNNVTKVFLRMSYDHNEDLKNFFEREKINFKDCEQKPLLIYWMPISNDDDCKYYFSEKISSLDIKFEQYFKDVDIFSVSLYFRKLLKENKDKTLSINIANIEKRIKYRLDILNKIIVF